MKFPIFKSSPWSLYYVNSVWIKYFVSMLRKWKISFKLRDSFLPQPQRSNDWDIMNDINTYIKSTITLQQMNASRLYLNVTFISEIVNTQ